MAGVPAGIRRLLEGTPRLVLGKEGKLDRALYWRSRSGIDQDYPVALQKTVDTCDLVNTFLDTDFAEDKARAAEMMVRLEDTVRLDMSRMCIGFALVDTYLTQQHRTGVVRCLDVVKHVVECHVTSRQDVPKHFLNLHLQQHKMASEAINQSFKKL